MATRTVPVPRVPRPRLLIAIGVTLVVLIIAATLYVRLYTDLLLYRSLSASKVFTTVLSTRILLFVIFGLIMAIAVGANIVVAYLLRPPFRPLSLEQQNLERYRVTLEPFQLLLLIVVSGLFGILAGASAAGRWQTWLLWRHRTSFGVEDPQFHRDVSYYMFTYPFQRFILGFLFWVLLVSLIAAVATHYLYGGIRLQTQGEKVVAAAKVHLSVLLGLFALLKAVAYYLDRFGLMFSSRGRVTGASYTDIHAVLPAKLILLFISLLCAVLFIYNIFQRGWILPTMSVGILVVSSLVIGGVYPAIIQQFTVKPNESTREAAYISRNIQATTAAYDIRAAKPKAPSTVSEPIVYRDYQATTTPSASAVHSDTGTIPYTRLLDPNELSATWDQLQQIRGYYGFPPSLDVDRYTVPGRDGKLVTQDYVVAARELDQTGLSPDQRNWINLHLTYTHGKGFVAAPANTVDSSGKPVFAEKGLPVTGPLDIKESRIYFGEQSPDYSIVGTKQAEIDGPGTTTNSQATNTYQGKGGVSIGSTWRKGLFALRFGDRNILLSSALTSNSRILYERNPRDRVQKVAPWLTLDGDPYPAVVDGRITWIIDGYTTSDGYPYSERKTLGDLTSDAVTTNAQNRTQQKQKQFNYIRNSVKATVDAYDGTVTLYQFGPKDPVLQTWEKAFPGIIKPESAMSTDLKKHLRYPEDLFKVQRDLIGSYHVTDPKQFYTGEDFWAPSAEPDDASQNQPPFYLFSQTPGENAPHFNLTSPLINRKSSKLAAYVSVSSDPENYGQFEVLQLPEGVTINGPTQVQAAIESNGNVNQQLTPLRLGGSKTVTGNLLTLPVAGGLLYIEPYYVVSTGSGGYPTLQRIAVVFGDKVGFASTLADALNEVFGPGAAPPPAGGGSTGPTTSPAPGTTTPPTTGKGSTALQQAIADAQAAYTAGQKALAKDPPDFTAYGKAQQDLQAALGRAAGAAKAAPASPTPTSSGKASPSPSATPTAGRPAATPSVAGSPSPSP
jgi:uncharacterized membrane protein (UPF0182 family)